MSGGTTGLRTRVGQNVGGQRPWGVDGLYINAVKTANWFSTVADQWGASYPVDKLNANGYPTTDFVWTIFIKLPQAFNGDYAFSCTGKVDKLSGVSSPLTVANLTYDPSANRTTGRVVVSANKAGQSASMTLKFVGVSPDLGDVRVLRPGYESDEAVFTDEGLNLYSFMNAGVVRVMEFCRVNNDPSVKWSDRTTPDAVMYTYRGPTSLKSSARGCPLEHAILLANKLKADLWYCLPAGADDEFVVSASKLIADTLDPALNWRLQLSNENWNTIFDQCKQFMDAGEALRAAGDQRFADVPSGPGMRTICGRRYYALRAYTCVGLARAAFGPARRHRVKATLDGQAGNPDVLNTMRAFLKANGVRPRDVFNSYTVAFYYGQDNVFLSKPNLTPDDLLAAGPGGSASYLTNSALASVTRDKSKAFFAAVAEDGIPCGDAYEGGTGFTYKPKAAAGRAPGRRVKHIPGRGTSELEDRGEYREFAFDAVDFRTMAEDESRRQNAYAAGDQPPLRADTGLVRAVMTDPRLRDVQATHLIAFFAAAPDASVYCLFTAASPWDDDSSYGQTDDVHVLDRPKVLANFDVSQYKPLDFAPPPDPMIAVREQLTKTKAAFDQLAGAVDASKNVLTTAAIEIGRLAALIDGDGPE